jgi:hypothetical protein
MLREIHQANGARSPWLVLHQIALVQLDNELANYLSQTLLKHWPKAHVVRVARDSQVRADLRICSEAPTQLDDVPTLWLWHLERASVISQVAPKLWRTPMPMTARQLVRAVRRVFAHE